MATKKGKPEQKAPAKPVVTAKKGEEDAEERIESAIGRTEQYIINNGKKLLNIVIVIVLVIGGYMAYKHWYQAGRADKAAALMFVAQQNFAEGMWEVALDGDGNNAGFLEVISKYGSTPQGNVANHYAGMCYVKLGETDQALQYLGKYKNTKGVPSAIINAENLGLQGDIYSQNGDYDKAVEMYRKAVKEGNDMFSSPLYLKKIGLILIEQGKGKEAEEAFQQILDMYPSSMEAREAEKYIGAASAI
ncbi:tetratricopeptide repeat protein [Alistipes sp. OttesenSCG-928-B03]|nr:tetratricopeptide repeat protein [Alistipes sp. OttesenSCG-928-B03]